MCDTAVALPIATKDKKTYFAKNSDREPNEAQYLEVIQGTSHHPDEKVKCTYFEIPQIEKTFSVLLSKPYWIWGAEMGVNENGVAIGNEAVFTKLRTGKEPGLIGMDMLRLALERSASAEEALHVIVGLLEKYGQSGNCSATHGLFYHNSFLIADRKEAWVLETADKQWAALKVKNFYSISNRLTIGSRWDLASEDLVRVAIDRNWCKNKSDFHFADCYSDFIFSTFSRARNRRNCTNEFLLTNEGKIDIKSMFSLLRQHTADETWAPDRSLTEWTVCMHEGFGPIRQSQTTGSLVCRLSEDGDQHFATGTSAPCLSLFKPIWLDVGLPETAGPKPDAYFNGDSLWWDHELLHRTALKDFSSRSKIINENRNAIENEWLEQILKIPNSDFNRRKAFSENTFVISRSLSRQWYESIRYLAAGKKNAFYYDWQWRKLNRNAKIPV